MAVREVTFRAARKGSPVSKERAQRRAAREREQAIQAAARAAAAEREERRTARKRALTSKLPRFGPGQSGLLAQRRRHELTITICVLAAVNLVVWISRPDWASRVGALLVSLLAAPVVHILLHQRR